MSLTDTLKTRRSVRRFADRPVPHEVLQTLLDLALTAPSSKNTRSTRFMVVSEPATLAKIAQMRDFGSAFLTDAPCGVLVLGDTSATDLWLDNAAISATFLQVAAADAGLGSCWVHVNGRPRWHAEVPEGERADETATDFLRDFLPIPAGWNPLCFVALGYPAEPPRPRKEHDDADKIVWL
jgi:nitroreductase